MDIGKLLEMTLTHYEKKDYAGAEKLADELIAAHPDFQRGWFIKAVILEETGRAKEAEECFQRAGNLFTLFFRLAAQLREVDSSRALQYYDRVLLMDPHYSPALLGKGLVLEKMGRAGDAKACYRSLSAARELISRVLVPLCFMGFLIGGGVVMFGRGEKGLSLVVFASAVFCFFWLKRDAGTAMEMLRKKRAARQKTA